MIQDHANTASRTKISEDIRRIATAWSPAFLIQEDVVEFSRMEASLRAQRHEINTSSLRETRAIFSQVRTGKLCHLGLEYQPDFEDVIRFLCVMATHSRLARASNARLRPPGFWTSIDGARRRRPVLPISQAVHISGYAMREIQVMTAAIVRDGGIYVLRRGDALGLCLSASLVDDREHGRLLRR